MAKLSPNKPLLFMLYGFPGAGKTSFARQLAENFSCAHLHADRLRGELFGGPTYSAKENKAITHLMNYLAEEFLSAGISVIYDDSADRAAMRHGLRNLARKRKAHPVLIWLQTDTESAYARLLQRDRRKSDDKFAKSYTRTDFDQAIGKMQNPKNEDFIVISGKHAFGAQKNAVLRRLFEMNFITNLPGQANFSKPGMVNLVPHMSGGRVDMTRRNIRIH